MYKIPTGASKIYVTSNTADVTRRYHRCDKNDDNNCYKFGVYYGTTFF